MDDMKLELSARYYIAEVTVWLLSAILIVARVIGLAPSQPLPLLNVMLENNQHQLLVVVVLLIAAFMYLVFEWKQSSQKARGSYWAKGRVGFAFLCTCVSLWLCYPLVTANTSVAGISPAWYFGFGGIGFLLGMFVSSLAVSSLLIRTPTEANVLKLPRIPNITRTQFKACIPIVILLLIAYYVLWYFSPDVIKGIGVIFVFILFLFKISAEFAWLQMSQDENGKRIPRLEFLRKYHNTDDYDHIVANDGPKILEKLDISTKDSPQSLQKALQEKLSAKYTGEFGFHVKQEEGMQIERYYKDGNKDNKSPNNYGIKIHKSHGKKGLLRVLVIPAESGEESLGMEIPIGIIEKNAEQFISTHTDSADLTFRKILSYAINQTVIQEMAQQEGPLLLSVVEAGQEERVKELLLKQDVDVNERAEGGWTALLYASAQGYPRILCLLLDAGANPDMANLLGITPLIYSARYGNLDVCKILLEHGADTDLRDMDGQTALMIAAARGQINVVKMLLKAGANIAIKDRYSMTALDIAQNRKQGEIAKLIRRAKKGIQTTK
jgi:hypothetical protein